MKSITKLSSIILIGIILSVNFGCTKEETVEPAVVAPVDVGAVQFNISYEIDEKELTFDTIQYKTDFGNEYGISKLEYYISDITFVMDDGKKHTQHRIHYMNARMDTTNVFSVDMPIGSYKRIELNIGLNADSNTSYSLPSTMENLNMFWPEPMGGGYHFIKMEGHFTEGDGTKGYAMHVGTNICLIEVGIDHTFEIGNQNTMELRMNINEWFRNPILFDLATANYIMGDEEKMLEIAENGHNIFSMK